MTLPPTASGAALDAVRDLLGGPLQGTGLLDAIERVPALLTAEAEEVLDRLVANTNRDEHRRELERIRRVLRDVRANGLAGVRDDLRRVRSEEFRRHLRDETGDHDPAELTRHPAMIHWREGTVLLDLGRTEEAVPHLEQAADGMRTLGLHAMEAETELLLWRAVRGGRAAGRNIAVLRHVERAAAAYRKAGDDDGLQVALTVLAVDLGLPDGNRARSEYYLGQLAELDPDAGSWFRSYVRGARQMWSDAGPGAGAEALRWCMDSLHLLGGDDEHRTHWRNECARKLAFIDPAVAVEDPGSDDAADRLTAAMLAMTRDEDDSVVAEHLAAAVRLAEQERGQIRSEAAQRVLSAWRGPIYQMAAVRAERAGRPADAVDLLELNTSRSLLARLTMNRVWAQADTPPASRAGFCQQQSVGYLTDHETYGTAGHRQQLHVALTRLREAVADDEKAVIGSAGIRHPPVEPATVTSLAGLLAGDDAVLTYSATDVVYLLTRDGARKVASFDRDRVDQLCGDYHRLAGDPRAGAGEDLADVVAAIEAACVDPVRAAVAGARRVVIVPHEALWKVPLAGLGADPLHRRHAVSYVPSLSILRWLLAEPRPTRRVQRFVGIGDPDGTLPHAVAELVRAASGYYDHSIQLGPGIDVAALLAELPEADVVHLACHGILVDEFADLASLHLAGAGRDRRLLWAPDVVRLSLRARLVVLAACHAGLSEAFPGNEYAGLPGVFLAAGARAVLGPLWQVDDRVTATLMDHFHAALPGAGPAAALRHAQDAVRAEPATAHPYYWAAFQLFGVA